MKNYLRGAAICCLLISVPIFNHVWKMTHRTWQPSVSLPLSEDELYKLGSVRAIEDYCNIATNLTQKAQSLRQRFADNQSPSTIAALSEIEKGFRNEDCYKVLVRFPDMMQQWNG